MYSVFSKNLISPKIVIIEKFMVMYISAQSYFISKRFVLSHVIFFIRSHLHIHENHFFTSDWSMYNDFI